MAKSEGARLASVLRLAALAAGSSAVCWVCGAAPPVRPEADHFVPLAPRDGPVLVVCRRCNRGRHGLIISGAQTDRLLTGSIVGTLPGRDAIEWAKRWAKRTYGSRAWWKIAVADTASRDLYRSVDGLPVKCRRENSIAERGREKHGLGRRTG